MSEFNLPESLEGLTSEGLQGLHDQAVEEFNTLNASDDLSNETIERMSALADAIDAIRARQQELADNATRLAAVRGRVAASMEPDPEPEPATATAKATVPTPPNPAPEPEPASEPEADPEDDGEDDEGVTASGPPSRSIVPAPIPSTQVPETTRPMLVITAAADIPQITSGSQLDLEGVSRAMHLRARTLADHSGYVPVATMEQQFENGYDLGDLSQHEQFDAIVELSGANALTAAGGWCAPSEPLYGFFDIECARGSILSLPTFKANRGGVTWPVSSPLPPVNTTDWIHTEDDDIAGYEKPCIVIPCPTWEECRLEAHGICVTAGNLMDRAFPENVRRYLAQVFVAHERNENLRRLQILIDGSETATFADSFGAASALLNAILLQASGYRDKYRMCCGAQLEAVFPCWVQEIIRGDIARQEGSLNASSGMPTNSDINAWFSAAGISAQFVNDWQPLGDNAVDWPATVQFLLYAPGTWVEFNGGTLDLGVVRDSVLNSTNDFTAAWMETFWCIGMRGYESRLVTVPVCPSGEVGERALMTCSGS